MIADCVGRLLSSVYMPGSQKQAKCKMRFLEFKLPTGANTSTPPPALRSSILGDWKGAVMMETVQALG